MRCVDGETRMSTIRRSIGLSVVGMLSLILPVGIVAWSV